MDRRLARRNLRTAYFAAIVGLLMFALTFVAASSTSSERRAPTTAPRPSGEEIHMPAPSILPLVNAAALSLDDRLADAQPWYHAWSPAIVFLITTVIWIRDTRRDIADLPLDHSSH